jgi:hypothetical protein
VDGVLHGRQGTPMCLLGDCAAKASTDSKWVLQGDILNAPQALFVQEGGRAVTGCRAEQGAWIKSWCSRSGWGSARREKAHGCQKHNLCWVRSAT